MSLTSKRHQPPGLMLERTFEEAVNAERIRSILAAMGRYEADHYPIPPAWIEELKRRQQRAIPK